MSGPRVDSRGRGAATAEPARRSIRPRRARSASTTTLGADDRRQILGALEARVEALDRAALPDVERLAGRPRARFVDESDAGDQVAAGQRAARRRRRAHPRQGWRPSASLAVLYTSAPSQPMRCLMLNGKSARSSPAALAASGCRLRGPARRGRDGRHQRHRPGAAATTRTQRSTAGRAGRVARVVRADVRSTPRTSERLVGAAVDRFGGLDILINNAGIGDLATSRR